ncbi:hypothetical protein HJP15_17115 [Pseudoalteromonas sp. NEC-BIFX-2020_002]|uniref:hypothetical protein n=1 Tax=Pseudoalteromonas sp. NEC-BIFX-2020_002 TaxID=2732353 RepID=UPI001476D86F|nr:hypothetical protein [Pseudoalteromonas sp. NEC-BIFX-2020_002]NNG44617.1 hypothetical protein [Pseudoalteromonas sp. NEC-BIFX-2020_002]
MAFILRYRLFMGSNHTTQALPCLNTKHTAAKSITKGQHALDTVYFASDTAGAKVKVECLMLERLTTAILKSSQRYPLVVKERIAGVAQTEFVLKATYTNVNAHRWVFPSLRPSSSATVKAEILKNDQVVATISKEIGSGAAFGACDRLEKIALAGGRYISKWAAKQNYN